MTAMSRDCGDHPIPDVRPRNISESGLRCQEEKWVAAHLSRIYLSDCFYFGDALLGRLCLVKGATVLGDGQPLEFGFTL